MVTWSASVTVVWLDWCLAPAAAVHVGEAVIWRVRQITEETGASLAPVLLSGVDYAVDDSDTDAHPMTLCGVVMDVALVTMPVAAVLADWHDTVSRPRGANASCERSTTSPRPVALGVHLCGFRVCLAHAWVGR